jgi:RNA polymerase sigma factor (sigma-70 family)
VLSVTDEAAEGGDGDALLALAREGDEGAFQALVEVHRAELHAHCYRMLAPYHDAEDALQEALLRAWRALPGFEGRSTLRGWLYKIATNAALDVATRRNRRELSASFGPPVTPGEAYQDKYAWPVTVAGNAFTAPFGAPAAGHPPTGSTSSSPPSPMPSERATTSEDAPLDSASAHE